MAVEQIGARSPDGVSIGGATTDKASVYGVTPVVQAAAVTAVTAGSTTTVCNTSVAAIITALKNFGITA
jgi:hypothetical protein